MGRLLSNLALHSVDKLAWIVKAPAYRGVRNCSGSGDDSLSGYFRRSNDGIRQAFNSLCDEAMGAPHPP
jgi:hypothetical protein